MSAVCPHGNQAGPGRCVWCRMGVLPDFLGRARPVGFQVDLTSPSDVRLWMGSTADAEVDGQLRVDPKLEQRATLALAVDVQLTDMGFDVTQEVPEQLPRRQPLPMDIADAYWFAYPSALRNCPHQSMHVHPSSRTVHCPDCDARFEITEP